jgi:serine/threonine protein kinase
VDDPRFAREISTLATLRHPAIVGYLHHGAVDDEPYLVMEWLDGEDLGARLKTTRLELAQALAIARQLAGALAAAHEKGVVHRDVKPQNLFLVEGKLDQSSCSTSGWRGRPAPRR